ncbi:MAG: hypothetical protein HOP34_13550 [Methylococcaceae bacterium]|nr:hypothetical protein [Methylococcaceae bacterium]
MKKTITKIIFVLFVSLLVINCGGNKAAKPKSQQQAAEDASLLTPTKEILVTAGDINKKYTILGKVDYTMKGHSIYSDQIEANKQAEETLKKVAFTKYGDKVDAIINTQVMASMKGGFWGAVGAGYGARSMASSVQGIAVSFDKESGSVTSQGASDELQALESPKKSVRKNKRKSKKVK